MKISKIFHWLYASLMLLPLAVFIPNAFYYGFNHEAIAQEKTEQVPVYYDTNNVTSINDLVEGNVYRLSFNISYNFNTPQRLFISDLLFNSYTLTSAILSPSNPMPYFYFANGYGYYYLNSTEQYSLTGFGYLDFTYRTYTNESLNEIIDFIGICNEHYVKNYVPVTTTMSITDSMIYAWHSTWHSEIFSWAFVSFLTGPFTYIGDLFGLPYQHTFYYALSYWLAISVIWLVFDVIMYVPLLCHRWIDKGGLE